MRLTPKYDGSMAATFDLTRLVRAAQMRDEIERLQGENRRLREDLDAAKADIQRLTQGGVFDTTRIVETLRVGDD